MALRVRPENQDDAAAVRRVLETAFASAAEADLVDAMRANQTRILSLVAELDSEIVGHIWFCPVTLRGAEEWSAVGLAPLAVTPQHQKQGVGSHLVREGLQQLRAAEHQIVVVLGDPAYYARFGFTSAQKYDIHSLYDDHAPAGAFQVLELRSGALNNKSGVIHYPAEFDAVG